MAMANVNATTVTTEPKFVERDRELVIGIGAGFTPQTTDAIKSLWDQFMERKGEIKNVKGDYALGVCVEEHPEIKKPDGEGFVYIAALPVSSIDHIPPGMVACELIKSRYAVFTHKAPLAKIKETMDYIWKTWKTSTKLEIKAAPDFELYDERFHCDSDACEFDIYVPIV
jgi:AraC family transcriptional regulator